MKVQALYRQNPGSEYQTLTIELTAYPEGSFEALSLYPRYALVDSQEAVAEYVWSGQDQGRMRLKVASRTEELFVKPEDFDRAMQMDH